MALQNGACDNMCAASAPQVQRLAGDFRITVLSGSTHAPQAQPATQSLGTTSTGQIRSTDPEQCRAAAEYLTNRFDRLARDRESIPSEFDRLIAPAEAWCRAVYAEAGLKPDEVVSDDLYPQKVWYASQIRSLAAEIRKLREREPDLVLGLALSSVS